jgi:hypothetical protein
MGVVADVARVPFGAVAAALLVWRDYRATRERLVSGAILVVAVLFLCCLSIRRASEQLPFSVIVSVLIHNTSACCPSVPTHACAGGIPDRGATARRYW